MQPSHFLYSFVFTAILTSCASIPLNESLDRKVWDVGKLTLANGLKTNFVGPNDYPSRAVNEGIEGVVNASIIVDPEGKIVDIRPNGKFQPLLFEVVRASAERRLKKLKFENHSLKYVRATLPPVQFRIKGCHFVEGQKLTEPLADAIIVTYDCKRIPTNEAFAY